MVSRLFSVTPLHENPDPDQRILGVAKLPADSAEFARLLATDPAPQVRQAAASRCADCAALATALKTEADPSVRAALTAALGQALALTQDGATAQALLAADECTNAVRSDVVRRAPDAERRRAAIACIRDEAILIELALTAGHAETRKGAAEQVRTLDGLKALAEAAHNKDRGVATLARARVRELDRRATQGAKADAVLAQLEAVAADSGPILSAVVNLRHRWEALEALEDESRVARFEALCRTIQARFDQEQHDQRARTQFEQRARRWLDGLDTPVGAVVPSPDALARLQDELGTLRADAQQRHLTALLERFDEAEERVGRLRSERAALDRVEALLAEAEGLAAANAETSADVEVRWQALDPAARTPAFSRRFEAAMQAIAQRRLARVDAARQVERARRLRLHELLHAAEQALADGQLQAARSAADDMKVLKAGAGMLPKPTVQRFNNVMQRLAELERWETFGQRHARAQLCERAEAFPAQTLDVARLAREVRNLREEWKALDTQHPGCPKSLWERFDRACEKAYAPAAAHFEQQAALKKEARRRREEFIAEAATQAATPPGENPDWRALDQWLRGTEQTWREGKLGSVDSAAWKALDKKLKAALAPLRQTLSEARAQARLARRALIEEAAALASTALERDSPSRIKALQARWQEQAKSVPLEQRDERALWEQFRAACNAVFDARGAQRKEDDARKQEMRRGLEGLCAQLEQLASAADMDEQALRRSLRELQEQWKSSLPRGDASLREIENRYSRARGVVETALSARAVSKTVSEWQSLAEKERMCRELDGLSLADPGDAAASPLPVKALQRWAELAKLPANWEQALTERRDGALQALGAGDAAAEHIARMRTHGGDRRRWLVEMELALGIDTPPEFQAERRALQVNQLKERFSRNVSSKPAGPAELLLRWCAHPGATGALDEQRLDRILAQARQLPVKL